MIRLLEFHRSPNCARVRIALGYKEIPFEMEEMSAADRSPMLRAANWPLVPVLLDGEIAMRDSEAILHYLESNYRDGPALTPGTVEEIRRGEALRDDLLHRLRPTIRVLYREAAKQPAERTPAALSRVQSELEDTLARIEDALGGRPFLLGDGMSLYDVVLACALTPARAREDYAAQSPMWAFFREHLSIPQRFHNVNGWLDRVLAYDREAAAAG